MRLLHITLVELYEDDDCNSLLQRKRAALLGPFDGRHPCATNSWALRPPQTASILKTGLPLAQIKDRGCLHFSGGNCPASSE